jgi:hypothetical protein
VNKFIVAGALALGLLLTAEQKASAWTKWSFNAGVSINYEGGNNNWFWGMFRSGQVPGYPTDVCMAGPFGADGFAPYGVPDFGAYAYGGYPAAGGYVAGAEQGPRAPEPQAARPLPAKTNAQAVYYPNQPAAYYPNNSYQAPAYGSYGNGYGYTQQVPSYWYGR